MLNATEHLQYVYQPEIHVLLYAIIAFTLLEPNMVHIHTVTQLFAVSIILEY